MAYQIVWTTDAKLDLEWFEKGPQSLIYDATPTYLRDQPGTRSRHKKPMGPNPFGAPWALRLDEVEARVYYDIDEAAQIVRALRVGKKIRNRVFIRGVETDMREQP